MIGFNLGTLASSRPAGFTPRSIAGLRLALESDAITASDGDTPATWADQSGNGFDATLTSVVYRTAIFGARPSLHFDGSTSFGDLGTPGGLEVYGPVSLLAVMRTNFVSFHGFIAAKDFSTGARGYGLGIGDSGNFYGEVTGLPLLNNIGPVIRDDAPHLIEMNYDGTNWNSYVDGTLIDTEAGSAPAANPGASWEIGRRGYVGFSNWYTGHVGAVFLYAASLSAPDRAALFGYAASKYGV